MTPHLTFSQVTLLGGTAVVIGFVLILIVYGFHKALRRPTRADEFKPRSPRADDDAAFTLATLQGVIATLKQQQKELQELQRATDLRAQQSVRTMEAILQAMDEGVIVFTRNGFIRHANPAIRGFLGVDTWSRRRYPEVLEACAGLAEAVRVCLETGEATRQKRFEVRTVTGEMREVTVSVLPLQTGDGAIDGVACLVQRSAQPPRGD